MGRSAKRSDNLPELPASVTQNTSGAKPSTCLASNKKFDSGIREGIVSGRCPFFSSTSSVLLYIFLIVMVAHSRYTIKPLTLYLISANSALLINSVYQVEKSSSFETVIPVMGASFLFFAIELIKYNVSQIKYFLRKVVL